MRAIHRRALAPAILFAVSVLSACSDSTSPRQQPPPGPGTDVKIAFCSGAEPNWLAFQDGDGTWTTVQPTVSGTRSTYQHTFNSDRGAVATARLFPRQRLTSLAVYYGKPPELAIVGDTNPLQCSGPVSTALLGTVTGFGDNEVAAVSAGLNIRAVVPPGADNSFALQGLTPGPQEILAARTTRQPNNDLILTSLILRRSGALPDGTVLPVFDFNSAEAFAPAASAVTVNGLGPEGASVNTLLRTAHSQSIVSIGINDMAAANRPYYAIPESHLEAGDLQVLSATAGPVQTNIIRSATLFFRAPVQQTLTLGAPLATPTFSTVATTPSLRLRAQFATQAEYDQFAEVTYQQNNTVVSVAMTAAYAAITGAGFDLVVPDLSHAGGFDPSWVLQPGLSTSWSASRTGGTLGLGLNAVPTEGATSRNTIGFGSLPQ